MKVILAGNYEQYLNYLRSTGETPQTAKYVFKMESLDRLPDDTELVCYGTWWTNPCAGHEFVMRKLAGDNVEDYNA